MIYRQFVTIRTLKQSLLCSNTYKQPIAYVDVISHL